MYTPMTNKAPQLIGTFNDIDVYDCRITTSMKGMKPGDMYVAEVLMTGELYAMRLNANGRLVGIDGDLNGLQAFCEAIAGWDQAATVKAISETFHKMLSDTLDKQVAAQ